MKNTPILNAYLLRFIIKPDNSLKGVLLDSHYFHYLILSAKKNKQTNIKVA